MCGRIIVVSKVEVIEKIFDVKASNQLSLFEPNYNLGVGQMDPVILSESPRELTLAKFGLTPSWAKKQMYLFNARSEGDNNKEDDPKFTRGKGIINKPSFRTGIRRQRCLVIADCFYEGNKAEGLSKPYLVYLKERRPFAMAGIWDRWVDKETGEVITSFSIITTVANELMQKIGHHRSPVILRKDQEYAWIKESTDLSIVTAMLEPYPADEMNAYPVSPNVKNPRNHGKELADPVGQRVYAEYDIKTNEEFRTQGMGHRKSMEGESWSDSQQKKKNEEK